MSPEQKDLRLLRARVSMLEDAVLSAGDLLEGNEQPPGAPPLDYLAEGFWEECERIRREKGWPFA